MESRAYPIGTVLKIRCTSYWHYGMSDGGGGVIHNSKKRRQVQFDTIDEFAEGREVIVSSITSDNPEQAFLYAKKFVGTPYNIFSQNCEQFVRQAHGLPVECTQFQRLMLVVFGSYLVIGEKNRFIKIAGVGILAGSFLSPSEKSPYRRAMKGAVIAAGGAMWLSSIAKGAFSRRNLKRSDL
ncbi:lecithin retinol acyltransferase family protein [Photobacterium swingsii]|uniref:lecithin retinol acyltransferase family protein n=1 Tax=Photobacterium swingsii TaxID=680026 RepID=UPI00352C99AA